MRKKRYIALCLCIMLCLATSVQAAPLTDFDTWRGSFDLGVWRTGVTITEEGSVDFPAKWKFYGGITHELGGPWGLQYRYHGMGTKDGFIGRSLSNDQFINIYGNYKGSSNEFNLIYSLNKGVALFAGANRVHNELRYTNGTSDMFAAEGTRTHFQGGLVAKAPLNNKVDAYGLIGAGAHGLFQAEAGFAFKMKKDWEANVGYRWFRVKEAFDEAYSSQVIPHNYSMDPTGTVKAKSVKFGLTHYFGPTPKKVAPPIVIPPVVKPPVIQPPIVQPKEEPKPEKIILKGVNFDFDMDTLQAQSYPVLNNVVNVANKNPQWNFVLIGHTDGMGSDAYNMDLSMRRVTTVQRYLVDKGVAQTRLAIDWKGEREPIATNDTAEGRAENRRVELIIK